MCQLWKTFKVAHQLTYNIQENYEKSDLLKSKTDCFYQLCLYGNSVNLVRQPSFCFQRNLKSKKKAKGWNNSLEQNGKWAFEKLSPPSNSPTYEEACRKLMANKILQVICHGNA